MCVNAFMQLKCEQKETTHGKYEVNLMYGLLPISLDVCELKLYKGTVSITVS